MCFMSTTICSVPGYHLYLICVYLVMYMLKYVAQTLYGDQTNICLTIS